jgi:hypothetical protein
LAAVPPLCQLVTFVVIVANPLLFRTRFLVYTVQANDKISAQDFDIDGADDIVLTDVSW